jgi:cysteinyl-tRNA synthetase
MALKLYNSLSRSIEPLTLLTPGKAGVYTCGPTVYSYVTIGNWRTYFLGDLITRTLTYGGITAQYYMNITDVGHLTGDNEGDADSGLDRMEKAKAREGKNAWEIADFYAADFLLGYEKLNLSLPISFLRATKHIDAQIALVQKLWDNGLAYQIDDGVYFDTVAYEAKGYTYGELSNLDAIKAGARVELNPQKRNPRDFALWKTSPTDAQRDMEWPSPWGVGFPGWHIECSAMSMQYLGEQFDIHVGGEDLKSTHHPNEIAQAQGATGKVPFVHTWVHGAFLQVDGGRMGKSLGNAYTLHDIEAKGISPLSLRYFYLSGHYRSPLNFTWEALGAAETAFTRLREHVAHLPHGGAVDMGYKAKFTEHLENDLDTPKILALIWELLKDASVTPADIRATILDFDTVLGLDLDFVAPTIEIPEAVLVLAQEREAARLQKDWTRADELRIAIEQAGYTVKDTDSGPEIRKHSI